MHYQCGKNRDQVFMTSMEGMVDADSWARIVDLFVDALPILEFGFQHSRLKKEGNLPYHPSDLFKLLLYGYRNRIRSAPKLAEACRINVEVMWLIKGLRPSERTINYFRANNTKAIEEAHRHFVKLLKGWKLIDGNLTAVDGTKVRGQNSLKNNFNEKKIKRHLDYIDGKMSEYLKELEQGKQGQQTPKWKDREADLTAKLGILDQRRERYKEIEEQVKQSHDGQVSLTDPDARAVVQNRGIVQVGYNIQTVADSKHKLVVDVFAGGVNDSQDLSKAARRTQQILEKKKIDMLADAGYHNGIELARTERMGVRPFVSPRKNHSSKEEGFKKENFKYNPKTDTYTCPADFMLTSNGRYYRKTKHGNYRFKRYRTAACYECSLKKQCTTQSAGRVIERPIHQAYTERNDQRVKRNPSYYKMRAQIIEHIFGTWKRHWNLDYALVIGKQKVETEYRLAAICYNLRRSLSILGINELKRQLKMLILCILNIIYPVSLERS